MASTLVHTADTLTAETPARDRRNDTGEFLYTYAFNYARRALRPSTNAEGAADAPPTVRGRKVSGRDAAPVDRRWTERYCRRTDTERDTEIGGSDTWTEQLDDDARDVAQDAFLLYWTARGDGRAISTRTAVRDALRERRQKLRQRSVNRRCQWCRYVKDQCVNCKGRMADDEAKWARYNRSTIWSAETRDTLSEVSDKPDPEITVIDSLPTENGTAARKHMQTLIRWVASGSSLTDVAEKLGIAPSGVQKLLVKLRSMFDPADFRGPVAGRVETVSDRTYGQGQGSKSSWIGGFLDILDREHGHICGDYMPTTPVAVPNETVYVPKSEDYATCKEWFDTFGPELGFILANEVYSE